MTMEGRYAVGGYAVNEKGGGTIPGLMKDR